MPRRASHPRSKCWCLRNWCRCERRWLNPDRKGQELHQISCGNNSYWTSEKWAWAGADVNLALVVNVSILKVSKFSPKPGLWRHIQFAHDPACTHTHPRDAITPAPYPSSSALSMGSEILPEKPHHSPTTSHQNHSLLGGEKFSGCRANSFEKPR